MRRFPVGKVTLLLGIAAAYGLLAALDPSSPAGSGQTPTLRPATPDLTVTTVAPRGGAPLDLVVFGLLLGLAGVLGYLLVAGGGDADIDQEETTEDEGEADHIEAVGRAAGRAADRIAAEGDGRNEVYRAWHEMTRLLDVSNPDATSPEEFADHAVEAGMAPDDVRALTQLFEEVRYGGQPAEERADLAVETFRRIEAAYSPAADTEHDSNGQRHNAPASMEPEPHDRDDEARDAGDHATGRESDANAHRDGVDQDQGQDQGHDKKEADR